MCVAVGAATLLGAVSAAVYLERRPETTAAIRGKRIAARLGCFACHGPEGQGGVGDPSAPGSAVPDWRFTTAEMFIRSEQDIRDWILLGRPEWEATRKASEDDRRLVPMPAYQGRLSATELDDLVAYFRAVSGWNPSIPDDAFEGRKIAMRLGCFGCHGPSGMGGVANPGSFKGWVPPWDGHEFVELVRDDQELRAWILDGRIERLWRNPLARHFLSRQSIAMPAYGDHISDWELDRLIAYIQWLRSPRGKAEPSSPSSVIAALADRSH